MTLFSEANHRLISTQGLHSYSICEINYYCKEGLLQIYIYLEEVLFVQRQIDYLNCSKSMMGTFPTPLNKEIICYKWQAVTT